MSTLVGRYYFFSICPGSWTPEARLPAQDEPSCIVRKIMVVPLKLFLASVDKVQLTESKLPLPGVFEVMIAMRAERSRLDGPIIVL